MELRSLKTPIQTDLPTYTFNDNGTGTYTGDRGSGTFTWTVQEKVNRLSISDSGLEPSSFLRLRPYTFLVIENGKTLQEWEGAEEEVAANAVTRVEVRMSLAKR